MSSQLQEAPSPLAGQASACQLFLVRHGTTTMNVENRYRGRRDVHLAAFLDWLQPRAANSTAVKTAGGALHGSIVVRPRQPTYGG